MPKAAALFALCGPEAPRAGQESHGTRTAAFGKAPDALRQQGEEAERWNKPRSPAPSCSRRPHIHPIAARQNHRMVGVGRDLCGSPSPTLLPKQGHLQQAVEDLVQAGLETRSWPVLPSARGAHPG